MEKLARIYDDEILPVWGQPFGRMLLRGLEVPDKSQVLDVACGTGYVTLELLRRMGAGSRVIAIDAASVLLDVARRKVERTGTKGVFFRTESAEPRLSFAEDVYDTVVCNLGLAEMEDTSRAMVDFARVTRPGGEVRCTIPLTGTFQEFYDIYREVLIKHDKREALDRLDQHLVSYPTAEDCEMWMHRARLADARVEVEEFSMLFKTSREFFFAPVIEYGPLQVWKDIAGQGPEMQNVFWHIKEAIDSYFQGQAFRITVKGGCLVGTKREVVDDDVTGRVERSELARELTEQSTSTAVVLEEALIESEMFIDADESTAPVLDGTRELDIDEIEEIEEIEEIRPDDELAGGIDSMNPWQEDVGFEAIVDGREPPAQVDDD